MAQAFARVGAPDPRLNSFGELDFRLQAVFRSWKKSDPPPTRVKPLPLVVLRQAHSDSMLPAAPVRLPPTGHCLLLAYFFLLRPGEYSGVPLTAVDDRFRVQDVGVWIGHRRLDLLSCPAADLLAATFVTLTFTNQKTAFAVRPLVTAAVGILPFVPSPHSFDASFTFVNAARCRPPL